MSVPFGVELTTGTLTAGGIAAVVVLLGLSAFFSSAEIAMFSLPPYRVDAMVAAGQPGAGRVAELKSDPHRLLVTILVGNNVVNIGMASISTAVLALHLSAAESVLVATFGITGLVLLFGESAPKAYAVEHSDSWARRVARPLQVSEYLTYPLVAVFDVLTAQVNRLLGSTGGIASPYVTRAELRQLIESGERTGELEEAERELLLGVLAFRNRIAKEVMQSRLDVVAVDATAPVADAVDLAISSGHDTLPVYEGTLDSVAGVVELPELVAASRADAASPVGEVADPVMVIPETKHLDDLLVEMREGGQHLAVVVDEYGTTQGLVTLVDVLEEIVGEVLRDAQPPAVEPLTDGTVLVRGTANVHELNEALGTAVPEREDYETVAGFVIDRLGRLPEAGEVLEYDGLTFEVLSLDRTRIRSIRVARAGERES